MTGDDLVEWTGSRTWARETRRGVRASLRSFYAWGVTSGRVATSPAAGLAPVRASEPRPRPASNTAVDLAMRVARPRERVMVRLAAEAGLRRAEVAQVHHRDLVEDLGGWSLVVHGKGSRERTVPLSPGLALELRTLIHNAGGGWAFPGDDGGHLSPRWVGKLVTGLLPEDVTMHALRHRFATRAYGVDRDLLSVQTLLGHASPVTTRVYVQVPDDALRRTVLAIA
ncbi:tyrosine-type recombinase/integrase [Occultella glacieicola]|uniref:tyrosine-type recombinase/integrase n=1 Tax=Occultella glacieicola TaxID=2518684 RepID=UPI001A9DD74E|nr:tyrosine-type recombinase/integrase [Occultella glacieicola]